MNETLSPRDTRAFLVDTLFPAVETTGHEPTDQELRVVDKVMRPWVDHLSSPKSSAFASASRLFPNDTVFHDDSDVDRVCIAAKRRAMTIVSIGSVALGFESDEKIDTLLVWDKSGPVSTIWIDEELEQPFVIEDIRQIDNFVYETGLGNPQGLGGEPALIHTARLAGYSPEHQRLFVARYGYREGKFVIEAARFAYDTSGAITMKGYPAITGFRGNDIMISDGPGRFDFFGPKTISAHDVLFNLLYPRNGRSCLGIESGGGVLAEVIRRKEPD